jgi:hypothetical protein
MLVSDLMQIIRVGNLSQINPTDESLIASINIALNKIYRHFHLNVKQFDLTVTSAKEYDLPIDFISAVRVTSPMVYHRNSLGETDSPATVGNMEMSVNKYDDYNGILIPNNKKLRIEFPIIGQVISISYDASPVIITLANLHIDIPIADQYLEAIMDYATYTCFLQQTGGSSVDTNLYLSRYTNSISLLETEGVTNKIDNEFSKFTVRGYK